MIFTVGAITAMSYGLQPLLGYFALRLHKYTWVRPLYVSKFAQFHRTAVEETTGQRFNCQLRGIPLVRRRGRFHEAGITPEYDGAIRRVTTGAEGGGGG